MKIIFSLITCFPFIINLHINKPRPRFLAKAPSPTGGYSVLQDNIEYPTILKNAGIEQVLRVTVEVDSTGTITSVDIRTWVESQNKVHSAFSSAIESGVRSVKWNPAFIGDRPIKAKVSFPLFFVLTHCSGQEFTMPEKDQIPTLRGSPVTIAHEAPIIEWSPGVTVPIQQ